MSLELKRHSIYDRQHISKNQFFSSFLYTSYEMGVLDDSHLQAIQVQVLRLLKDTVRKFTSGESSSVSIEKAEELMKSILFTISFYLKTVEDLDWIADGLKQGKVSLYYQEGLALLKKMVISTKRLWTAVDAGRLAGGSIAYHDTINAVIKKFFRYYDIRFMAHDVPVMMDYPVCFEDFELEGIEFIRDYGNKLLMENQFCRHFNAACVQEVTWKYNELLINLYEAVLYHAVCCIMAEKTPYLLTVTHEDCRYIEKKWRAAGIEELQEVIQSTMEQLSELLGIKKEGMKGYMQRSIHNFSILLHNGVKHESLYTAINESIPISK